MSLFNRQTLKNFFKKGQFPTEVHFSYLIDSTVNKIDDGFAKSETGGLSLSPVGESEKLISVYDEISDEDSLWQFELDKNGQDRGLNIADGKGNSQLYFKDNGKVGVHTEDPEYDFEVNGTIAALNRIGIFSKGNCAANGDWHTILTKDQLQDLGTFEIIAQVKKPPKDDTRPPAAATLYGIATHCFDKGRVRVTRNQFGFPAFFYRLCLRWHGKKDDFCLQMRTGWNYGLDEKEMSFLIHYHVMKIGE